MALRAWWRVAAAMLVMPARRRAPMAALRMAAMTWADAGAGLVGALAEGDVADPVEPIFDRPVSADPVG